MPDVPNIDIRPDHWQIVRDILCKHVPQYEVWAFGSRAKWAAKQYSDLDLAILTDRPLSLKVSASLADDFSESDLPWKVDVVDWATTSESFRKIIERDKVVVQGAEGHLAMVSEWPACRLEELAAQHDGSIAIGPFGSRLKADSYVDDGVVVIRGTNLRQGKSLAGDFVFITPGKASELGNANLKPGDLVFPHRGAIGEVGIVPNDGKRYVLSTSLMKITLDEKRADPEFFFYVFKSAVGRFELLKNSSQVGTPGIATPLQSLRACIVPCPSIESQKFAIEILGTLDDRINNLRQTNATLEAIAATLFKSRFAGFDGVLKKDIQESELGVIPKGWRVGTLGECCDNIRRQARPEALPPTTPYIGLEHMPRKSLALTELGVSNGLVSGKFWYQRNDILFGKLRPYFHKVGVASHEGVCSTDILVMRAKPHWFGFTAMHLFSDAMISYATQLSNGAKMPRTNWSDIAGYNVVLPPVETAAEFDDTIRPLIEKMHANIERAATLAALRDTLLPRLISGRLRIGAAA